MVILFVVFIILVLFVVIFVNWFMIVWFLDCFNVVIENIYWIGICVKVDWLLLDEFGCVFDVFNDM